LNKKESSSQDREPIESTNEAFSMQQLWAGNRGSTRSSKTTKLSKMWSASHSDSQIG